jgi:nucleoid DNA-binding protein
MDKTQKDIIKEASKNLGFNSAHINELYMLYFKFIKTILEKGTHNDKDSFLNIRIPEFGIFCFHEKKFKKIINHPKNKFYTNLKNQQNEQS